MNSIFSLRRTMVGARRGAAGRSARCLIGARRRAAAQAVRPGQAAVSNGHARCGVAAILALSALGPFAALASAAAPASTPGRAYVPGQVVVGYGHGSAAGLVNALHKSLAAVGLATSAAEPGVEVVKLPAGIGVAQAIARLRRVTGVTYAVPNVVAHIAARWFPNDPGRAGYQSGWERMQWNFLAPGGVDAPGAWANLIAEGQPGGRGVVVAIVDTGVAYRNWHAFRKSPDFVGTKFVHPYDFVARNRYPLDREGHGTFVAGTIAEATNNALDLTGLAYGATVMPVRVLDANGNGDAVTISRGIRYAVQHGAQVINLSLEFPPGTSARDIPDIISAVQFAHRHGVTVVASAGNDTDNQLAYPAAARGAISVGATTRDRCLADYSNDGPGLDLVAPGGGDDSSLLADPDCHPERNLPSIFQLTLLSPPDWAHFGYPDDYTGTSMASAHVSAIAALVIASGVIGRHPTPNQILHRLEETADPLGGSKPNTNYGYGLVNAAAATAAQPAGPARAASR